MCLTLCLSSPSYKDASHTGLRTTFQDDLAESHILIASAKALFPNKVTSTGNKTSVSLFGGYNSTRYGTVLFLCFVVPCQMHSQGEGWSQQSSRRWLPGFGSRSSPVTFCFQEQAMCSSTHSPQPRGLPLSPAGHSSKFPNSFLVQFVTARYTSCSSEILNFFFTLF